jgi:hypothetical protein
MQRRIAAVVRSAISSLKDMSVRRLSVLSCSTLYSPGCSRDHAPSSAVRARSAATGSVAPDSASSTARSRSVWQRSSVASTSASRSAKWM